MSETSPAVPRRFGRGVFLATVAGGVSSLLWGKAAWDHLSHAASPVESLVPLLPSGGWRIYTVSGSLPRFDEKSWRLRVGGHVRKPVSLSYRELLALPKAEQVSTFHCVTGWSVDNVKWGGVRLNDVLASAHPFPSAHALEFVSAEKPYVDSLTVEQAGLRDVMLAYEMDGRPLAIALLGDRRGLARLAREVDRFDRDDLRWLLGRKPAPQGRFNAGQKLNTALTAAFTVLFLVSGLLLWFGERDTRFRFAGTVVLHDGLMYVALVLLVGHLYLALIHPATRHALRGITVGTVDEEWAARHHAKWRSE